MFVSRNQQGKITGVFARPQVGLAEEELPDNHSDIINFLAAPDLKSYAAKKRWEKEREGITFNNITIPTDDRTQNILIGAYVRAIANSQYSIPNWKLSSGNYITLDANTIISIGNAVSSYIQACFDKNAEIDAGISNNTITTVSQIDELYSIL